MNIKITKAHDPLAKAFARSIATIEAQVEIQKLTVVEELLQFMKRQGINRSELAERMGVGPSRITKILSGDENLTIDTLVRAGRAVGADLAQTFVPQGHRVHWHSFPKVESAGNNVITFPGQTKTMRQAPTPQLSRMKPAKRDAEDAA